MKKEVYRIRRAYSDMLRETSPEAFEKTIINVRVRVKDSDSNFTKLMEMDKGRVIILNSMLWPTYMGYLHNLIYTLGFDSSVDFNFLESLGCSHRTVDMCKAKFRDAGVTAKSRGVYYLNPHIAYKGKAVEPELMELFNRETKPKKNRKPRDSCATGRKLLSIETRGEPLKKRTNNVLREWLEDELESLLNTIDETSVKEWVELFFSRIFSILSEFCTYRLETKHPIKKPSFPRFMRKLIQLSGWDPDTAILILDRSIANGWQGIFSLDEKRTSITQKTWTAQL